MKIQLICIVIVLHQYSFYVKNKIIKSLPVVVVLLKDGLEEMSTVLEQLGKLKIFHHPHCSHPCFVVMIHKTSTKQVLERQRKARDNLGSV